MLFQPCQKSIPAYSADSTIGLEKKVDWRIKNIVISEIHMYPVELHSITQYYSGNVDESRSMSKPTLSLTYLQLNIVSYIASCDKDEMQRIVEDDSVEGNSLISDCIVQLQDV